VPVQMELRRIIISEVDEHQVIVLKEVEGDRSFPIVIGIFEATSIDRRVRGMQSPRPLTHDLITSVVDQLGGDIQDIVISDLQDHTYFAKLRIRHEGELIEVDCRPSDAVALAVTARVPIYVNEAVLGEALDSDVRVAVELGGVHALDLAMPVWYWPRCWTRTSIRRRTRPWAGSR
jgi:uncharacterized protein